MQSSTLPFTHLPPAWLLWAFMGPKCTTCSLSLGLSAQAETLAWGLLLPHPALLPWLNAINFPNQARGLSPAWQICQHSSPTHHEISNSLHLCPPGVLQAMSWNVLYVCAGTVGMSASPTPLWAVECQEKEMLVQPVHMLSPHTLTLEWALYHAAFGRTHLMPFLLDEWAVSKSTGCRTDASC